MKSSEIAPRVLAAVADLPLHDVADPPPLRITDLAALALVPWFSDLSVQWTIRLAAPGTPLKKTLVKKVNDASIAVAGDGALLIGIPGDGLQPSTHTVAPIAAQLEHVATPGMTLELVTANLGEVLLDESVEADAVTAFGNQRYVGTIGDGGTWRLTGATPTGDGAWLRRALDAARLAIGRGPWTVRNAAEARAIVLQYALSRTTSRNYIKKYLTFRADALVMGKELAGQEHALALAVFRERLAGGPFGWTPFVAEAEMFDTAEQTQAKMEAIADGIVGS